MDWTQLITDINNWKTVISNWARNVEKLYFSGTPQNIEVDLIDENGNLVKSTLPNVAQFRQTIMNAMLGALGLMERNSYVDNINGSDTNDGKTPATAFKTLVMACNTVPIGGIGKIIIIGEYVFNKNITIINKNITIEYRDKIEVMWYEYANTAVPHHFILDNTTLRMKAFSLENGSFPTLIMKNQTGLPVSNVWNSFLYMNLSHANVNIIFDYSSHSVDAELINFTDGYLLNSQDNVIHASGNTSFAFQGYYSGRIIFGENANFANVYRCGHLVFTSALSGISYKNEQNETIDIFSKMIGIIKDGNGNAKNISSNLIIT